METLGVGLISCGVMGGDLARNLVKIPRARLAAVCDADAAAARKLGAELGAPQETDFRRLLERRDLQAVLIASPCFLHREMTEVAAAAGKHVFCEKPMAVTTAECDAMIAAAKKARVKLMIGHVLRYHPLQRRVKELAAGGELGAPICMSVHRLSGGWSGVWARPWRQQRAQCGGLLLEVNVHELDWMRWVCGEVVAVCAVGKNFSSPSLDYEDTLLLTMQFQSGAVGLLHSSIASAQGGYGGRMDLERGSVAFPQLWGNSLTVARATGEKVSIELPPADTSPVQQELADFVASVLADREPPITGADGRAAVAIAEAAYRSVATGKLIPCEP